MNRREAIKRTAMTMGGLAFVPGALSVFTGCTPGNRGSMSRRGSIIDSMSDLMVIDSVSVLCCTPGVDGETAFLAGYRKADDGGGSEIYWDSECTDTADDGMVFKVDGVTKGRWRRPEVGYINVKWFGARGDGVFKSGIDNEVHVFDKCLDWISKNKVKKIYVPEGLYILEHGLYTQIDSKHNGLELYGDGETSELKFSDRINRDNPACLWMISWATKKTTGLPLEDMYIHDLKFNGNRQGHKIPMEGGNTGYALWVNGQPNLPKGEESKNIRIERVHTCNHNTSGLSIRTSNTVVKDCRTWGHFQHGVETHNDAKDVLVDGLIAWKCGNKITNTGYGVDFSSGENLKLTNFEIYDCWAGFKTSVNIKSVEITNGIFRDNWGRGLQQTSVPNSGYTLRIDNVISQNNPGGNRFDDMKSLSIGTFISRNDGNADNAAILVNNNVRKFHADSLEIYDAKGMALRVFTHGAIIEHIVINGASGSGIQGKHGGNHLNVNGGVIDRIDGDMVHARGSESYFKLTNIEFIGPVGIRVDPGSTVDVIGCDFTKVSTSNTGGGMVKFDSTSKIN
ncbi:MAG: glycosyl hydrolase family 28-related protein [Balneolales bacterium]